MRTYKLSFVLTAVAAVNLLFFGTPVKAADTSLRLAILPLQCNVEIVDDGIQVVVRITPQSCERVVKPTSSANVRTGTPTPSPKQ